MYVKLCPDIEGTFLLSLHAGNLVKLIFNLFLSSVLVQRGLF